MEEIPQSWVVYQSAVEGLFVRAYGNQLNATMRLELKQLGIDLEGKLLPAYKCGVYEAGVDYLRNKFHAHQRDDAAHRDIGTRLVDGFYRTIPGMAAQAVMRIAGPDRLVARLGSGVTSTTNFMSCEAKKEAPQSWVLEVSGSAYPLLVAAAIERSIKACGSEKARVELVHRQGRKATLRATW